MVVWSATSDTNYIYCIVPSDSVLQPVLFCMYAMPMEDIVCHYGFQYMMYTDDIQLYLTRDGDQVPTGTIEECVGEIGNWMSDRKTEVILFSSNLYGHGPVPSC